MPFQKYAVWKAEKSVESETQEPVKKRKVESQVKKSEKKSPKREPLSPKRRTPQTDSFGPDFKKTIKETRKLQVFENDDIWE